MKKQYLFIVCIICAQIANAQSTFQSQDFDSFYKENIIEYRSSIWLPRMKIDGKRIRHANERSIMARYDEPYRLYQQSESFRLSSMASDFVALGACTASVHQSRRLGDTYTIGRDPFIYITLAAITTSVILHNQFIKKRVQSVNAYNKEVLRARW